MALSKKLEAIRKNINKWKTERKFALKEGKHSKARRIGREIKSSEILNLGPTIMTGVENVVVITLCIVIVVVP